MELAGARVAVTGATGFLGRYLVDVLLARGASVVGVVRNPARVPELAARGVELRRADLLEPASLVEGFRDAQAVVSNAALFALKNQRWREHQETNVTGTRNVFTAVADAGVERVVHVSSVAVYKGRRAPRIGEDHPTYDAGSRRSLTNTYPISKAVSERLAWEIAAARGLALTTVRPCGIYGAFDANFTTVFRRFVGGLPVALLPVGLRIPFVYAGDVAEAIALALERPVAIGKAYNVTGDDRTFWEFARAWRAAGGRIAPVRVPIPLPLRRLYDNTRAEQDLGWQNRPFADGLRDTFGRERGPA
jgi:nucleoside-diphosphate-sugar epimerase